MLRSVLTALLLGAPFMPALAQVPPDAGAAPSAHALPFPGTAPEMHAVELALGGAAEADLVVRVASAPPWLRFDLSQAPAAVEEAESVARLAFSVDRTAPVGEAATVDLVVTDGSGVERARHGFAVIVEAPVLALEVPRPNPSRGGAAVAFTVGAEGLVRVSVVDMLGREVAVLADGDLAAGAHQMRLPALASGAYVVRLATADEQRVERFTVVR